MVNPTKTRYEINPDLAKALGLRFCAERHARTLSHQEVADALLFSKLQVVGLETGDPKSFYSAKMFGQAADKYAKFLAFDDKPSESLYRSNQENDQLAPPIAPSMNTMAPECADPAPESVEAATPRLPRKFGLRFAFLMLCAIGGATLIYSTLPGETTPAPPQTPLPIKDDTPPPAPTVQVETPPEKNEPNKGEPATVTVEEKTTSTDSIAPGHIQLRFSESSWVQSVDLSGHKQEKFYRKGETLDLEPARLQALIIGNASAVTMLGSQAPISLKPYVASGSQVARIIGPQIRKLAD